MSVEGDLIEFLQRLRKARDEMFADSEPFKGSPEQACVEEPERLSRTYFSPGDIVTLQSVGIIDKAEARLALAQMGLPIRPDIPPSRERPA